MIFIKHTIIKNRVYIINVVTIRKFVLINENNIV
jgi:hypothetical protein